MRLSNRQNWQLNKPRCWVYLILSSQQTCTFMSLRMALAGAYGNTGVLFGPPLGSGFWSQVWHRAEERYSMVEKQLLAAYSTLQVVETITQMAEVIVKTTLPIQGWVKDLTHLPKMAVAQALTVA